MRFSSPTTARGRWALATIAAAMVALAAAPSQAGARAAALPKAARTATARAVRRADPRIEKYRQKYLVRGPALSLRKLAEEARLAGKARKLGTRIRAVDDPRPILVILEGPDGAGKSGAIRRLRGVFNQLGAVRVVHFGAPPAGEKRPWLARYRDRLPKAGQVAIWDRSYYGRVVYDPYYRLVDEEKVAERYGEIEALEAELAHSYRVVKVYLDARGDRLARTIGKREALAPDRLGDNDYQVFRDRKIIRSLFEAAMKRTGGAIKWHVVPMDDRGEGRFELLEVLRRELVD